MPIVTIKSEELTVKIKPFGAEITSVTDSSGREYIWSGDEKFWAGQAPVLFPVVGRLFDSKFTYCGKSYEMPAHGFAKDSEFEVEYSDHNSATFLLCSNDETRKIYPFDFEFRVTYKVYDKSIAVDFETKNLTDGDMCYSLGAHEGYALSGDVSNYSLVFSDTENAPLYEVGTDYNILEKPKLFLENTKEIKLSDDLFAVDAMVFFDLKSGAVALRDDRNGETINVEIPGFNTLLVWKVPKAEYVCIEPWSGTPDLPWKEHSDFSEKFRIRKLSKGSREVFTHIITFE